MKNSYLFILILIITTSCAPKLSSTWTSDEYQGKTYSKIAVVGISNNLSDRNAFEQNAVELLRQNGINAIEGIAVFPPNYSHNEGDDEKIIKTLEENKVDGVITMSLINERESQRYVPGEVYRVPLGWRRFRNYYFQTYGYISTDGYYRDEKAYLIEAVFYDVSGKLEKGQNTMVWSGQSSLVNPFSAENAAEEFTNKMVKSLIDDNVILVKRD